MRTPSLAATLVVALSLCGVLHATGASAQDPKGSAPMQVRVSVIWVHDVPAPPQGAFWDSALSSALGIFGGRAGIYPDVVVCARAAGFSGRPICTQPICTDLQGDTKLGSQSMECQRPLAIALPTGDPRMYLEVLEMDDQQVHAIIARNLLVADPSQCPHVQPCSFEVSPGKGPLVLSFSTNVAGTLGSGPAPSTSTPPAPSPAPAPLPAPAPPTASSTGTTPITISCQPWAQWRVDDLSPVPTGLHGPYASVNAAVLGDRASTMAFLSTQQNPIEAEYGFLIVRDSRQPSGGYYTTPPVEGTAKASATDRPKFLIQDYQTSLDRAFAKCAYIQYFAVVATVHTHPNVWSVSDSFSADDFTQAIQLRAMWPTIFEKIVMINAYDWQIRTFIPETGDKPFNAFGSWVANAIPIFSVGWMDYWYRVEIIGKIRQR